MYKFKRHVDQFGPGDDVPEGRYLDEHLERMVAAGMIEAVDPPSEPPKAKRTIRKK